MADFVAIECDDEYKAHEVRLTLLKLQAALDEAKSATSA